MCTRRAVALQLLTVDLLLGTDGSSVVADRRVGGQGLLDDVREHRARVRHLCLPQPPCHQDDEQSRLLGQRGGASPLSQLEDLLHAFEHHFHLPSRSIQVSHLLVRPWGRRERTEEQQPATQLHRLLADLAVLCAGSFAFLRPRALCCFVGQRTRDG